MRSMIALMVFFFFFGGGCHGSGDSEDPFTYDRDGIIRGSPAKKALALVFTGDRYADGAEHIRATLHRHALKASFFFTGNFYREEAFADVVSALKGDGHYLGAHSNNHLLYCSWENRDSLLVTKTEFIEDLEGNYQEMARFGIRRAEARYFMPPYEWYNAQISAWTAELGLTLINFTPGTRSNADYTTPDMGARYLSSDVILQSILGYEQDDPNGLSGFILLIHIGTAPERTDTFYRHLDALITALLEKNYRFERIDALLAKP